MLSDKQIADIEECRRKRYSSRDICRVVGVTDEQLQHYIGQRKMMREEKYQPSRDPDPTPEEIEAACAVLREQQRRNPRYDGNPKPREDMRMPRHYCNVSEFR